MPIYQYDINSAYARTYRDLPCLLHGKWRHVDTMPKTGTFVGIVRFRHVRSSFLYTLPVRLASGSISFPRDGEGTYWSPELGLAREQGCELDWIEGYEYVANCECHWFDWVEELYAERKRMGKDASGMVLKIMLATIYGKLAQSVGTAPYANPIWAGLITSSVRAQLCRAALADSSGMGADVVMLATDGLFCTEPRPSLDIGKNLGQWDLTVHDAMFVVQSGVYMLSQDDTTKYTKTRGVSQRKVIQHTWDFLTVWERYLSSGRQPTVTVVLRQFIGIKVAAFRNRLDLAGQWVHVPRTLTFDWSTKRSDPWVDGGMVRTRPPIGGQATIPYGRLIGGLSFAPEARQLDDEQPDWSDTL